jgi:hypothetical protein
MKKGLCATNETGLYHLKGPEYSYKLRFMEKAGVPTLPAFADHVRKGQVARRKAQVRRERPETKAAKNKQKSKNAGMSGARRRASRQLSTSHLSGVSAEYKGGPAPLKLMEEEEEEEEDHAASGVVIDLTEEQNLRYDYLTAREQALLAQSTIQTNGLILILLDANEMLIYRHWDVEARQYDATRTKTRPFAKELVEMLMRAEGVEVGIWMGTQSDTETNKVLALLKPLGIKERVTKETQDGREKRLRKEAKAKEKAVKKGVPVPLQSHCVVFTAFEFCKRNVQDKDYFHAGTTKPVYVKPVQVIRTTLPQFAHILLVDNDLEKSLGLGNPRTMANADDEHLEISPYRGEEGDVDLEPGKGAGALAIMEKVASIRSSLKD